MKKIQSLFKRDYEGNRQVYNEVVPGSEWVLSGEGVATIKWDGTSCMIRDGRLYKRYDRKLTKSAARKKRANPDFLPVELTDYKPAPDGWEAAEPEPNQHTGHWPGWLLVDFELPENQWHKEAWEDRMQGFKTTKDGTYELLGPKIQGNPYRLDKHFFLKHGESILIYQNAPPRDFEGLKQYLFEREYEGIVWHHPDGRMVKIKRRDFGFEWPIVDTNT